MSQCHTLVESVTSVVVQRTDCDRAPVIAPVTRTDVVLETPKPISVVTFGGIPGRQGPEGPPGPPGAGDMNASVYDPQGIEADAFDRSHHTGTQTLATISDAGTAASKDVPASGNATNTQVVLGSDTRLSDARAPTAHTHTIADVTGLQAELDGKQPLIHAAPAKPTPADADEFGYVDSAASWELKKLTFANLAAWVRGIALTGLSATTDAAISVSDSIISALGKLQAQINSLTYKLPAHGILYFVDTGRPANSPELNVVSNGSFYVWPSGMASSVSAGSDSYVCGNWRLKSNATCTASSIQKIDPVNGGLQFSATFAGTADYLYLRQLAPVVTGLADKTFTLCADVEVDAALAADVYVMARRDTADGTRVLVTDTPFIYLTTGRQRIACTFTVPALPGFEGAVDAKNSLEIALRFYGQSKTVQVKVRECVVVPGVGVRWGLVVNPAVEIANVETFYETGRVQFAGLSTTSGQKRIVQPLRTKKIIDIPTSVVIKDLAGNIGKCSTYDSAGVRTDNQTYTAVTASGEYVGVIINSSTAAGIAFDYTINCYP